MARLQDVALAAEVSVATVSRFLNGSLTLPAATAKRIDRAIRALNYRPNSQARRLSLGRSETIGLVIPAIANPFFAQLADAVELAAEARGLGVLLCVSRNQIKRELDYLALLQSNQVDGLLFLTNRPDAGGLAKAINAARHVVVVDEDVPGAAVPKIFAANEQGGLLAGEHLIAAGHRTLACIGGPLGMLSTTERLAGFRRAAAAVPGCRIVQEAHCDYSADAGRQTADALLAARPAPTAVFVTSDVVALGLMERLHERRVDVPRDLSLIAFDDVGPLNLFAPPLSAIRQPVARMGTEAVALLMSHIAGTLQTAPEPVRLPIELVARASVAPPRVAELTALHYQTGSLGMTLIHRRSVLAGVAGGTVLAFGAMPRASAASPTFAMIQINEQALFFKQMQEGAEGAAHKAGVTLVVFNANDRPVDQNNAIETYIQQKVAGILVDAIDVNGLMPAVQQAAAAGIPVVAVDAVLPANGPQKAQIGVDNAKAGMLLAETFLPYVQSSMGGKAKVGVVGALNSFIQNQRQKAFIDAITGQPGITMAGVVDGRNIQDNALTAAETLMTGNPDMTVIYATGEPALLGAIAAVESQGKQDSVKVFGWDLTAQAIRGIDAGYVVAVVQQSPSGMGRAGIDALVTLSRGGTVDRTVSVPVAIVTKANVDPYRSVFK